MHEQDSNHHSEHDLTDKLDSIEAFNLKCWAA